MVGNMEEWEISQDETFPLAQNRLHEKFSSTDMEEENHQLRKFFFFFTNI